MKNMKKIILRNLHTLSLLFFCGPNLYAVETESREVIAARVRAVKDYGSDTREVSEETKKCQQIAEKVCDVGEDIATCLKSQRRSFPSYCVSAVNDSPTVESIQSQFSSASSGVASCQEKMQASCKELAPTANVADGKKFDVEAYQVQLTKYHNCMVEAAKKQCQSNFDELSKSKGKNIQLIGN